MPQTSMSHDSLLVRLVVLFVVGLMGLALGLLVGLLAGGGERREGALSDDDQRLLASAKKILADRFLDDTDGVTDKILQRMDPNRIKEHFKLITSLPHIAGTDGDKKLASKMADFWRESGLEDVHLPAYHVLLSYPDPTKPNTVELIDGFVGDVYYRGGELTNLSFLDEGGWKGTPYPYPYLAYSPNGTVVGDPVFANYGWADDFKQLKSMNVSVEGKIVIVKHGKMMGGKKVSEAEKHGAVGVLVYSDPADVALNGTGAESVYPNLWGLPETGVARTAVRSMIGDPGTPGVPSKEYTYRIPLRETDIPTIPSHTISYKDAREILGRLGGPEAPETWHGGLEIPYTVGPGFAKEFARLKLRFAVHSQPKNTLSYNVVGFLYGDVEPDRYVIIGNHRDAWVQGAIDPGSGTAVLLELARVLGELHREGWRPRRTLVFCSWGAEEFGLIGSTEWVEEHLLELEEKTVAYINVDTCITGDAFDPLMSLTLKEEAIKVAKKIPDMENASRSLYDSWYGKLKVADRLNSKGEIPIQALDLYSDFGPFLYFAGIPIMDVGWHFLEHTGASSYPSYHTEFETINYIEKFLDPDYRRHLGCAHFSAIMLHSLANSAMLPFDFDEYVFDIVYIMDMINDASAVIEKYNMTLDYLNETLRSLEIAAKEWKRHVESADRRNPYVLRAINDHMLLIHKAFYNRITVEKPDSWLYRYGYERNLYNIYDILSDRKTRDANIEKVRKLLSNLTLLMELLKNLLTGRSLQTSTA